MQFGEWGPDVPTGDRGARHAKREIRMGGVRLGGVFLGARPSRSRLILTAWYCLVLRVYDARSQHYTLLP